MSSDGDLLRSTDCYPATGSSGCCCFPNAGQLAGNRAPDSLFSAQRRVSVRFAVRSAQLRRYLACKPVLRQRPALTRVVRDCPAMVGIHSTEVSWFQWRLEFCESLPSFCQFRWYCSSGCWGRADAHPIALVYSPPDLLPDRIQLGPERSMSSAQGGTAPVSLVQG